MEEKIKVCAYCRVSTDGEDQLNSYENQLDYFQNKTHELGNYELVGIYADKGLSATSMKKRKEFLQMIHDAGIDVEELQYKHNKKDKISLNLKLSDREPKFNKILVKNTSRFARNIEVVSLLRRLREKSVYVEFLDKNLSTENSNNDFFINMFLAVDERESKEKRDRIRFGILAGMEKGVIMANSRLYGYKKKSKYELEIIEEEANVIRYIFEQYAKGIGIRRIISQLNELGYRTRRDRPFSKSTISKILQNEKYKGWLVRNKYDTGVLFVDKRVTPKLRPKEEWVMHKGIIPAIVLEELWDKCQMIRESKISYTNQKGVYYGKSDYVNKIFCANCGHAYTKNRDRGRVFFNCGTKKTKGTEVCNNINISEKKLQKVLEELSNTRYYQHFANNRKYEIESAQKELDILEERLNREVNEEKKNRVENELKEIQEKERKILELYLEEKVSRDVLDKMSEELSEKRRNIEKKLNRLCMNKQELEKLIKNKNEYIMELEDYEWKKEMTSEKLLKNEIKRIEIGRANKNYAFGDDVLRDNKTIILKFEFNSINKALEITLTNTI
ncbi:recombinase family protein [Crassaminicella profunda]|uniref:recombinase family protein n=1 Tax=Crassaminicella profunda TaxID=1286698 RepID=UPI001CA66386|nr:recombinase family protein [Crassaminicella profunda]QZY56659.1 recombinase family protein [Crassaminicella profunda]